MANIVYRTNSNPTTPVSTVVKGSGLTSLEVDANMKSLDNDIQAKYAAAQQYAMDQAIALAIALG